MATDVVKDIRVRDTRIMKIEEIIEDGDLPAGSQPLVTAKVGVRGSLATEVEGLVPGLTDTIWISSDDEAGEDQEGPPALSIGPHYRVRWVNGELTAPGWSNDGTRDPRDVMLRIHPALLATQSFDTEMAVRKRGAVASALHHAVAHKDDAMVDFLLKKFPQVHCEVRLCAEEAAKEGYLHGVRRLLERMRATNPEEFTMADPYNLGSSRFGAAPLVLDLLKIAAAGNGRERFRCGRPTRWPACCSTLRIRRRSSGAPRARSRCTSRRWRAISRSSACSSSAARTRPSRTALGWPLLIARPRWTVRSSSAAGMWRSGRSSSRSFSCSERAWRPALPGPPEPPLTDEEWHNQWLVE